MKSDDAVEVWQGLAAQGIKVRFRPVNREEIRPAEEALGFRFPPSYVRLVTSVGAPAIGRWLPPGAAEDNVANMSYAVLTPSEVVSWTRELRESLDPDMFEEPGSLERVRKQLAGVVWFQLGSNAGEGFVFLLDTADASGEMQVGDYSHDYIEELDWSPDGAVYSSLAASTLHVAEQVLEDAEHYS